MITQQTKTKYAKAAAGEYCRVCGLAFSDGEIAVLHEATGNGRKLVCQDRDSCLDRVLAQDEAEAEGEQE
jgi:hypothetical protein